MVKNIGPRLSLPPTPSWFGDIIPEASLLTTTQGAREQALPYFRLFQFFDHTASGPIGGGKSLGFSSASDF
jgi:hypothetical protein